MNKLTYLLLTKRDISSTIKCVIKVFLYEEPMTKILKMTESEFETFVKAICEKAAKERMSYICKDGNNVVGFCLNEDLISEPFPESVNITPKMEPIFSILNKLDSKYLKDKKRIKGKFFHLFMVGSLKEYRNKGIARGLTHKSLALAKKKDFKEVVTEATNLKSQNLLNKYFNFKGKIRINYKKFKFNGGFPFRIIPEKDCKLMILKLK